ncbi:serine/threonine-protein kinase STE20-like isoform X2 [Sitophilus oryzae]|uniref:non-specific serine/threonine protein kinase n=1 Tax=Sitophilus oryzae TaxID=7048 RepID=A0A6J2YDR4_SITOR|nr:serine/threonine-protein kinase STE20-like isoform X2 [Sitophilus oryzae]
MPYYSELGIYTPSSTYTAPLFKGPYSNHSSIIASNILPFSKQLHRTNFRGYKPHLTTISEANIAPLRRISSPKVIYHSSPKVRVQRPIKINTADIDVSVNKYRNYKEPEKKSPSPKKEIVSEEKEAKPNTNIKRDRATIRLQTIHKDALEKEIGAIRSWRDNFKPEELVTEAKVKRKSPGEILKEKFLIRSKSKDNISNLTPPKLNRRNSVRKSPSFKDICDEITSNEVTDDLNPGQPINIRRRQSRQLSHDDLINEIKRSSSTLSVEEVELLDALLQAENEVGLYNSPPVIEEKVKGVKKKKVTRKKTDDLIKKTEKEESGTEEDISVKSRSIASRQSLKKSSSEISIPETSNKPVSRLRKDSSLQNMIKDISQVEIEMIPVKQKPVITGSVGDIEEKTTNNLKLVVEDYEIQESPKRAKKEKKFRFNVTVQEFPVKKKITVPKCNLKDSDFGVVQLSTPKTPVVTSILKKKEDKQVGNVAGDGKIFKKKEPPPVDDTEMKQKLLKSLSEVQVRTKEDNTVQKSGSNENMCSTFTVLVNKSKSDNSVADGSSRTSSGKLKIVSIEKNLDQKDPSPKTKTESLLKSAKSDLKENTFLSKSDLGPKRNVSALAQRFKKNTTEDSPPKQSSLKSKKLEEQKEIKKDDVVKKDENENVVSNEEPENIWNSRDNEPYEPPKLTKLNLGLKDPREIIEELQENQPETPEERQMRIMSKRSLIEKANKSDPDLKVFEPPTPPPPEPEKEPSPEPSFVPLKSNRLSQWMHPFKKPDQNEDGSLELYAKPKFIRARHIPRRWQQQNVESNSEGSTTSDDDDDSSSDGSDEDDDDVDEEDGEEEEEGDVGGESKVGASTSSNDSGFDSGRAKNKGSIDSRDSPGSTLNPALNPAFALDYNDLPEEVSQSSTYQSFQRSGRITPPATTIPRFRKYCVDDFNFLKVLGKGSFGKVLLAELKGTEYYYAVKCLKKDVVLEDDDVECTLIERKVLALGTKHPYLCHLLCTFQTESHLFFVMEYLNGGDLMFHIQAERRFSEARARFYGAEIVSGLKFLHNKGIVYRDLKLDNILLDFDGHVRIADFGMCKLQIFLDRMADTFCGTPDYMAPEIIKGQHYNQCVDWWSFGVLLYEMLLGQSPFSGCDEDELFWSICNEKPVIPRFLSADANSVLTQFLEKDANKRLGNRFSPHGDIQDHPFFQPIDWPALEARKLEPPFRPNLQHPLDTQYFDKTFTTERAKLTPIETPIMQSMDQVQFQGFSYTNPNATDK